MAVALQLLKIDPFQIGGSDDPPIPMPVVADGPHDGWIGMAVGRCCSATASERATHGCCRSEDVCILVLHWLVRTWLAVTTTPGTPILIITTRTIQGSVLDLVSDSAGPGRIGARGGIPDAYPSAYPYPSAYAYPYPYYAYDNTGSARLLITPRNAAWGRRRSVPRARRRVRTVHGSGSPALLPTGQQPEVQVYLEGYRSLTQKVLFTRGTTLRIESALQPLAPGEPSEPKPAPRAATLRTDPYQSHTQAAPHRYG